MLKSLCMLMGHLCLPRTYLSQQETPWQHELHKKNQVNTGTMRLVSDAALSGPADTKLYKAGKHVTQCPKNGQ